MRDELFEEMVKYLKRWMNRDNIDVKLTDDLYRVYGIVDEDLDDFIIAIASKTGHHLPADTSYWKEPVKTIGDAAQFIQTFPKTAGKE